MDHPIVAEIPYLRRYARALTRDSTAADDLVQDCLERAWSRFHLFRRDSNLRCWLFTVMHNLHANQRRDRGRRLTPVTLDDGGLQAPQRATQEDRLEMVSLEAALQLLPEEQRQVVLLVGLEELSYQEAASVLGVPIGTVMSRLHRGRERLRELIRSGSGPQLRRIK